MSETTWDVVIVGAGLSGLSAAHSLRKRNPQLKIIILEGKDRVGGRTVTEDLPAVNGLDRWDLGGQWVSSSQTHVMDLIHELGLEVYPQYTAGKKVQHIGGPRARIQTYSTSIPALSPLVLLDLTQLLWKIDRLCASVSVEDPSRTPNAAELDSMTLQTYLERHAWTQGHEKTSNHNDFMVHSCLIASAVGVVALPLKQLCVVRSAAKINYQPPLPSQREHLTQNMAPGHLIKFIITYGTAFWRKKGFSGEIVAQPSEACPLCVTFDATTPRGSPALVGFIAGLQAYHWSNREAEERREAVVCSLVRYLGPEASSYIHYREKDWATEEFSGGCPVSVMTPGLLSYHHPSLRRPCGRIHWAGTETATQWNGYMSGAIQAGQRAALEVLAELSPSSLTEEELEAVHKALASPRHLQPPPSSTFLRRALLFTVSLAAALLLARPQLCRRLIGWTRCRGWD
ncbi:amine oxidase [flavin-containing] B [Osmerus eperlanus]|uniref:amine oxidase [flavin-containing] B n=1 Tax=Osmerus eperlanus TaxID=29151 RepID=UPI002E0F0507